MAIGATTGVGLAVWSATAHLWNDGWFLAGFAAGCALTLAGVYVLVAEFIGGIGPLKFPLPLTRREREAGSSTVRDEAKTSATALPKRPVSDEHRDMLKAIASNLLASVRVSQTAFYGGPQDALNAQSFQEHFPQMATAVAAWNHEMAGLKSVHREIQSWVESRLGMLAYDQPPFAGGWDQVITESAERGATDLPFHVPQIAPLWLQLGAWPVVADPPPNGRTREEIENELRAVLAEAVLRPECGRVRLMRAALSAAARPLVHDLELIQAKDVISGLGDCVLCR